MANEYKSIYTGQEVDEAVATAQKSLTTDNIVQTTGPSQSNVMSQAAVTAALNNIQVKGTVVISNGVQQETWDADSKVDVSQGTENSGKAMVVGPDGNLSPQTIPTGGTSVTVSGQIQQTWDADSKINVFQGVANAGKIFVVGSDGNTMLQTGQGGGTIVQVNGVPQSSIDFTEDPQTQINNILQEVENNGSEIQTLQSDIEELGNTINEVNSELNNKQDKAIISNYSIPSTSWTELSNQMPFTYSSNITITQSLATNSVVELINNQAVLFSTYGFSIGNISGQSITIYSIGQPTSDIALTLSITI